MKSASITWDSFSFSSFLSLFLHQRKQVKGKTNNDKKCPLLAAHTKLRSGQKEINFRRRGVQTPDSRFTNGGNIVKNFVIGNTRAEATQVLESI